MIDWSLVIEIALFALVSIVVAVLVPWLKARLGAEKVNEIWKWVCMAVQAAEQLFGAGAGEQKKEYVQTYLAQAGVSGKLDADTIDVLIEAAVNELT